jgi:plastocyanin
LRILTFTLATLVLISGLAFSACGGDDDDDGGAPTQVASGTGSAVSATATQGGGGATFVEVDAADFSFSPGAVTAEAGVDLTFAIANTGSATHTFTLYGDSDYSEAVEGGDSGNIVSGTVGEFNLTLDEGEYFFRCEIHPSQMEGTLTAN